MIHFPPVCQFVQYHQFNQLFRIHCQAPRKIQFAIAAARAEPPSGAVDGDAFYIYTEKRSVFFKFAADYSPGVAAVKGFQHSLDNCRIFRRGKEFFIAETYYIAARL